MADDTDNLVLEHLRAIRSEVSQMKSSQTTMTRRLHAMQSELTLIHRKFSDVTLEIREVTTRIGRIERRLGLIDAT